MTDIIIDLIIIVLFFERSWCPDRTLAQARKYVRKAMGTRFAEPVILNLHATWEESDTRTPLICFLSMGSDPTDQIEALAKNLELGKTRCLKFSIQKKEIPVKNVNCIPVSTDCRAISMGQGQEVHARKLIQTSMAQVSGTCWREDVLLCCSVADDLVAVTAGRLGPSAELPSGSGVYGRTA